MNKLFSSVLLLLLIACNNEKKKEAAPANPYFSVVSFLGAQAKEVDTSLYRITVVQSASAAAADSTLPNDTMIIAREAFRDYAKDFLDLPDISSEKLRDKYDEQLSYDQELNSEMMTYTAKDSTTPVRREIILLTTNEQANSQVNTILVNTITSNADSTVEKDMTWHVGRRFQVITKVNKPNAPEAIRKLVVMWE